MYLISCTNLNLVIMIIGINAINIKSIGGVTHLNEIINNTINKNLLIKFKIQKIYIWAPKLTLKNIITNKNIVKIKKEYGLIAGLFWNLYFIRNEIKKYKCDILFLPDGLNYFYNLKKVILFQNLLPFDNNEIIKFGLSFNLLKFYFMSILYHFSIKKSDGIIFLNKYSKNLIEDKFNYKVNNYAIIPHGISKNYFETKIQKKDNNFNILYVSSFDYYKNQISIIKAVSLINLNKRYNVKLYLVGNYNSSAIKKIYKHFFKLNKSILKHLIIKNYLSEKSLIRLMGNMDLICFPSTCESMGLSLLEGMASHLPVICSNKSSMPKTFKNQKYLFNPYNIKRLVKLIEGLIESKTEREKLAKSTREEAIKYNWEETSLKTIKFINEIANQ